MFRRVGLENNLDKTNDLVCTPGYICGKWSELSYKRRASLEGEKFRERKRARVSCTVCGVTVAVSSLKEHMERQHGRSTLHMREAKIWGGGGGPFTYVVFFSRVLKVARWPVIGCPAVAHNMVWMREHFRHFLSWIAVVQEDREPLPFCNLCGTHIPVGRLLKHHRTKQCDWNIQMRWKRRDVAIASRCMEASFSLTMLE